MMNFTSLSFEKGQEIVVETVKGKFYGKFNKLSVNGSRLDIVDVKGENNKLCGAFKYFFKKDVLEVTAVNGEVTRSNENSPEIFNHLTQQQLQSITQSISGFTYIQQADAKYFEALENISKQFVIGISADCCRGR